MAILVNNELLAT